jgi:hypothetical protein
MRVSENHKTRDPIARALATPAFRLRTMSDKRRRRGRKSKHKKEISE